MSFAEAAQHFSEAPSAPMGGDIDYQSRDKLDPAYYEAALALRTPGKMSGIVRTALGFNVIKLTAIRPWEDADKALAKRMLFEDKRTQIFDHFMERLRAQSRVVVHPELLKE
jgi:parvulin-like peptidyl-prolyl isomerase